MLSKDQIISEDLRSVLKLKNLTLVGFALKIGVTKQTVSNWCNGFSIPKKYHTSIVNILENKHEDVNLGEKLKEIKIRELKALINSEYGHRA